MEIDGTDTSAVMTDARQKALCLQTRKSDFVSENFFILFVIFHTSEVMIYI
jgi:hypothetical protein